MRSRAWWMAAFLALVALHTAQAEGVQGMQPTAPAMTLGAGDAPDSSQPASSLSAANTARTVAVADGLSTYVALSTGASELNPLANGSPGGVLVLTGLKFGLVRALEGSKMPEERKRGVLRTLSAMWGAASVNNLLIAAAVNPPAALAVGVISGVLWWRAGATVPEPRNSSTEVAVALQP
jgi:hypothetical protein